MAFLKRLCMIWILILGPCFAILPAVLTAADAPSETPETAPEAKIGSQTKDSQASRDGINDKADKEREDWLRHARDSEIGKASWYGKDFHNRKTASGLLYDMYTFTAAHKTLPLGTVVRVTDKSNGKSVMVCVTDRGPFVRGRIIDLSWAAAQQLDIGDRGVCKVELEVISDETGAPLQPDHAYYIRYQTGDEQEDVGPFYNFADAAAMHEAMRQAHPDAMLVLDNTERQRP